MICHPDLEPGLEHLARQPGHLPPVAGGLYPSASPRATSNSAQFLVAALSGSIFPATAGRF